MPLSHCIASAAPAVSVSTYRSRRVSARQRQLDRHRHLKVTQRPDSTARLAPLTWPHRRASAQGWQRSAASRRTPPPGDDNGPDWLERVLGAVNVTATLGSVGGAVAVLVTEQLMFLYLPVVLPVVGLLAAAQRDRLRTQAAQREAEERLGIILEALDGVPAAELSPAALESLAALAEAVEAQAESSELAGEELGEKLAAIEAALLKTGRASRDAARQSMEMSRQMQQLAPVVAEEILRTLEERSSRNVDQFDSRLERLETGLSGLELSQEESLRRLARSISDGMEGMEASVLQAIESEPRQARLLPAEQYLSAGTALQPTVGLGGQLMLGSGERQAAVELTATERERLRMLVEEEVLAGVDQLLERQARREANRPVEAAIDEEQWRELQSQLGRIQRTLVALAEEQPNIIESAVEGSMSDALDEVLATQENGQVAKSVEAVLSAQREALAELRAVQAALAARPAASDGRSDREAQLRTELAPLVKGMQEMAEALSKSQAEARKAADGEAADSAREDAAADVLSAVQQLRGEIGAVSAAVAGLQQPAGEQAVSAWLSAEESQREEEYSGGDGGGSGPVSSPPPRYVAAVDNNNNNNSSSSNSKQLVFKDDGGGEDAQSGRRKSGDDVDRGGPSDSDGRQNGTKSSAGGVEASAAMKPDDPWATSSSKEGPKAAEQPPAAPSTAGDDAAEVRGEAAGAAERLLREGLEYMRAGRQRSKEGGDLQEAEDWLMDAEDCFTEALQVEPGSVKAQGNLGNALLARGQLKLQLIGVGMAADTDDTEAEALLIEAGRCFRAVLEVNAKDERALCNWAAALCARAELVDEGNPKAAAQLYSSAVDKYEAVLEEQPRLVPALKSCGIALRSLAMCKPRNDPDAEALLEDAIYSLEAAMTERPDDLSIRDELREARRMLSDMR